MLIVAAAILISMLLSRINNDNNPFAMAVFILAVALVAHTTQIKHQEKIRRAHGGELTAGRSAHGGAALHLHRGGRGLPHGRRRP